MSAAVLEFRIHDGLVPVAHKDLTRTPSRLGGERRGPDGTPALKDSLEEVTTQVVGPDLSRGKIGVPRRPQVGYGTRRKGCWTGGVDASRVSPGRCIRGSLPRSPKDRWGQLRVLS